MSAPGNKDTFLSMDAYAEHCRQVDIGTAPLRDCISYYNGDGDAAPGSLGYDGGSARWNRWRDDARRTLAPYVFESAQHRVADDRRS